MFKGCHLSSDLLARYSRSVDLCVAAALQRYCLAMPEAECPCAIRNWPWDAEEMDRWVLAHKEQRETEGKGTARAMPGVARASPHDGKARAMPGVARASPHDGPSKKIRHEPGDSTGVVAASTSSGASSSAGAAAPAVTPAAGPGALYSKWAEAP